MASLHHIEWCPAPSTSTCHHTGVYVMQIAAQFVSLGIQCSKMESDERTQSCKEILKQLKAMMDASVVHLQQDVSVADVDSQATISAPSFMKCPISQASQKPIAISAMSSAAPHYHSPGLSTFLLFWLCVSYAQPSLHGFKAAIQILCSGTSGDTCYMMMRLMSI